MTARQTVTRAAVSAPPPPPPRIRTRAIGNAPAENPRAVAGDNAPAPTKAQKDLAQAFFLSNQIANAAKSRADKARKDLFKSMKEEGTGSFEHTFKDHEGAKFIVDVAIETPTMNYIDIDTLRKLVKPDVFDKIITATKTAVETHAGKAIALEAEKTKPGTENVNVKARK
jgi:hypothetical protein